MTTAAMTTVAAPLRVLALVCTLSPSPAESSTELLAQQVLAGFEEKGCETSLVRVVDHDVRFGVEVDMGDGDAWPGIRSQLVSSDVLLVATPIWLGHASSVCRMVLERLDGELSEKDGEGRYLMNGKVGVVAVVGNEDGAHEVSAEVYQALADVGFTIPPMGTTYWHGPAMGSTDYKDLDEVPKVTQTTTSLVVANAVHLAGVLRGANFPPTA
jgi:multimeric flavodoxin WrbA